MRASRLLSAIALSIMVIIAIIFVIETKQVLIVRGREPGIAAIITITTIMINRRSADSECLGPFGACESRLLPTYTVL